MYITFEHLRSRKAPELPTFHGAPSLAEKSTSVPALREAFTSEAGHLIFKGASDASNVASARKFKKKTLENEKI